MRRTPILMRAVSLLVIALLALPVVTMAQEDDSGTQNFSKEQLAQLLAPIALYPDELIAQILMASTYPLEIVMADRWVRQNKDLQGEALARALDQQSWDPSVKSLVNFPSVLSMLSEKLDLTTKLGDAFLEQKQDVMDTIQELRRRAAAAGNLKSTDQQQVVSQDDTLIIEPVNPDVVYVPVYDPYAVYGPWWYPDYPPFYFYPVPSVVFTFGFGITLGWPWGYAWGGCDWRHHDIDINIHRNYVHNRYIDRDRYLRRYEERRIVGPNGRGVWAHNPTHRRGVAYGDRATARRFGQLPSRSIEKRREVRGFGSGPSVPSARPGLPVAPRREGAVPGLPAGQRREGAAPGMPAGQRREGAVGLPTEQRREVAPALPGAAARPVLPRTGGTGERGVALPGTGSRGGRIERGMVSRPVAPAPRQETIFTPHFGEGQQIRRSSERGRSSFGGGFPSSAPQPRSGGGGGGRGPERRR